MLHVHMFRKLISSESKSFYSVMYSSESDCLANLFLFCRFVPAATKWEPRLAASSRDATISTIISVP